MKKTLTPVGEDLAIIIDKPILDLLGIDTDTLLEVKTDGTGLIIKPVGAAPARSIPEATIGDDDLSLDDDLGDLDDDLDLAVDPTPIPEPAVAAEPPGGLPDAEIPSLPDGSIPDASIPDEPPVPSMESAPEEPRKKKKKKKKNEAEGGTPILVIEHKGEEVDRLALDREQLVVGREVDKVDLHLDDRALSRKHMRIEKRGAAIWINDLGSANGTFVNDERVREPRRLEAGDVVEVGHYQMRIEGLEERALAETPVLTLNGPEGMHRFAMVGDQIVIGRSHSCDISIGHKSISRRHVRILAEEGDFIIEDLGSQNGCKLNGKRLKGRAPFLPGDMVSMCDFSLELGYLEEEDDQASDEKPNRPRTMLIDASVMAGAAYVDGDMQNMRSDAGHMQVGRDEAARPDTGEYSLPD